MSSTDLKIRTRVYPEQWWRFQQAYEAWAVKQEGRVYFADWVRLGLERQADRDLGDTKPPEPEGTSQTPRQT